MAALATQTLDYVGVAPSYIACAGGGDTFLPDDRTFLHFKNTNAATRTVTIATPATTIGLALADVVIVVPATTGDLMVGPFPAQIFADPADGLCDLTYSAVTNLTVAVVRLPAK